MTRCPYCQSRLLQREYDGDITCLFCSRTVSLAPVDLPSARSQQVRQRLAAWFPEPEETRMCGGCGEDRPISDFRKLSRSSYADACKACTTGKIPPQMRKTPGPNLLRRVAAEARGAG